MHSAFPITITCSKKTRLFKYTGRPSIIFQSADIGSGRAKNMGIGVQRGGDGPSPPPLRFSVRS